MTRLSMMRKHSDTDDHFVSSVDMSVEGFRTNTPLMQNQMKEIPFNWAAAVHG